jgi:CheY-like chemotaxis protein
MEAVGQLTGGIAHDFNNMHAVIIGALNLIERRQRKGESFDDMIVAATEAAGRAAELTHRLLAFSRQLPLNPQKVDVAVMVKSMSAMLHRTLGEHIRLETVLAGGLWQARTDANQLENAILNLCINARDAMPDGGRLTIETSNAHLDDDYARGHEEVLPGQYVLIAVSDTGTGMTPDTIKRVFEPFFTTKPVGKGTGLGLSQVFGYVKQSRGHIKIYSELGQGTSVKLYLPRAFGEAEAAGFATVPAVTPGGMRDEVILLVEDEDRMREISTTSLRELGYTVLHSSSGARALEMLKAHPQVTLLFTDIVMPDMGGRQLADEALKVRPDLKVLFTTGYTRNAVVHNGVLDPGVDFLAKPFTLDQLGNKVREVLSRPGYHKAKVTVGTADR